MRGGHDAASAANVEGAVDGGLGEEEEEDDDDAPPFDPEFEEVERVVAELPSHTFSHLLTPSVRWREWWRSFLAATGFLRSTLSSGEACLTRR